MSTARETRGFQAEVKQLLRLMIHSLYSNREIFLRELVSNASDACDKLRFRAIAQPELLEGAPELAVDIDFDKDARTLTIADNGIGMSRDEVISHLGTIAKSGTAEFLSQLSGDQQKDAQLIGQFGVGFYSAFIVADRVEVYTRAAGASPADGVHWESDGSGEFTIETAEQASRGTRVVLHLKDDAQDYADGWRIRSLIKRYSDHIGVPVRLPASGDEGGREVANSAQALWTRPRTEIPDEEYSEFYQTVARDFTAPLAWSHNRVEGKREYTTLLYVPSHAPFDLYNRDGSRGLKLYVKRVFILDDAEQFLPLYLRFVKGVVDSSDLPLNVSRELLQNDADIEAMRSAIARRVLDLLAKLAKDEPEKYATFWKEFGQVLKEGVAEDNNNRDRIAKLLRFASTHTELERQDQSLDDYIGRMKAEQKHVYYLTAETWNAARQSPHLERLRKHGIEVLLMYDRVDEWMLSYLGEYEGKSFQDVASADLDLGDLLQKDEAPAPAGADELCERLKAALSERVEEVRTTRRLAESPACLVRAAGEMSAQMRKLMEAAGQAAPSQRPTLEINPEHPLVARLQQTRDDAAFADLALLLADQAVLAEGGQLAEPAQFVQRLNRLLLGAGATI